MGSRTLGTTIDTTAVVVALLQAELTGLGIQVHGAELPAGWVLSKTALVLGNGGPAGVNRPELEESFTVHSYGATPQEARAVDVAVFNALHRFEGRSATVGASTIYVPFAARTSGPIWNREPETEWPRWTSTFDVTIAEFARP